MDRPDQEQDEMSDMTKEQWKLLVGRSEVRASEILRRVCVALGGPEDPCPTAEAEKDASSFRELLLQVLAVGTTREPLSGKIRRALGIEVHYDQADEPEKMRPIKVTINRKESMRPGAYAADVVWEEGEDIDVTIDELVMRGIQARVGVEGEVVTYNVLGIGPGGPYNLIISDPIKKEGVGSGKLPGAGEDADPPEGAEGGGHLPLGPEAGE